MIYWQGKLDYPEKTYPVTVLSSTNFTWIDLESNLGCSGERPVCNALSHSDRLKGIYNEYKEETFKVNELGVVDQLMCRSPP